MAWDKLTSAWILVPFSPLAYIFFSDKYASSLVLKKLPSIPTLVIHGTHDLVVPFKFGEDLYSKLDTKKWFWKIENGTHTDVFFRQEHNYREDFVKFLKERSTEDHW